MQRVSLINGKNKNQDYDLSKIRDSLSSGGVVEGLEVKDGLVTSGYAFVPVARNGITFNILFTLSEDLVLDTSGDKKVFIEVNQSNLNDGSINSSDGTGIGNIKTGTDYPSDNFLSLADIVGGVITDNRSFIYLKGLVRKGLSSNSIIYIDSNGNEIVKVFNPVTDNGKAILIDETNGIRFESPGVDIGNLTEASSVTNDSELIINVPGEGNKKVRFDKIKATDTEALSGTNSNKILDVVQAKNLYSLKLYKGFFTRNSNSGGDLVITHNLGRIPKVIRLISFTTGWEDGVNIGNKYGIRVNGSQHCKGGNYSRGDGYGNIYSSNRIFYDKLPQGYGDATQTGTITSVDNSTITMNFTVGTNDYTRVISHMIEIEG